MLNIFTLRQKIFGALFALFLVAVAVPVSAWKLLQNQKQYDAAVINTAGRQRMLVQKMAAVSSRIGQGDLQKREELRAAMKQYAQFLSAQMGEIDRPSVPDAPAAVQSQLRTVNSRWDAFRSRLTTILQAPRESERFEKALAYIQTHTAPLLRETDQVVGLYQEAHQQELHRVNVLLAAAAVGLLVIAALLAAMMEWGIVRPIHRLQEEAAAVADGELNRKIDVTETGDEVGALMQSVHKMKSRLVRALKEMDIFRTAVEHAGHSIYWTDAEGTIQHVNAVFEEMTGYSRTEAVGKTPRILQSGEHTDAFYEDLWSTIKGGRVWQGEIIDQRPDGERYVIDQTIAPIENGRGEIEYFVAVSSDITEKKQYEQALRDERDRFETLFTSLPTPVVRCTYLEGRAVITDANPAFERVFGIDVTSAKGEDIDELLVPESERGRARELDRSTLEHGTLEEEVERRTADGLRTFQLQATGWSHGDEPAEIYASYIDITDRKQRENELERQNERLDRFASVLSHDLRNPLNVAKGRLEIAQSEHPDEEPEHLIAVGRALERMNQIIEDVLTLTWGRKRVGTEALQQCDLDRLAETSWQHVETARATLRVEDAPVVEAETRRLQQLLENLFRNAVEHAGDTVTVTVGALPDGFSVADDGPGIPRGKRTEVLKAGYTSSADGTGLGLSIVRSVAEAHGWELSVGESDEGGARFEFRTGGREAGDPESGREG